MIGECISLSLNCKGLRWVYLNFEKNNSLERKGYRPMHSQHAIEEFKFSAAFWLHNLHLCTGCFYSNPFFTDRFVSINWVDAMEHCFRSLCWEWDPEPNILIRTNYPIFRLPKSGFFHRKCESFLLVGLLKLKNSNFSNWIRSDKSDFFSFEKFWILHREVPFYWISSDVCL